jgi:hypothetical protein
MTIRAIANKPNYGFLLVGGEKLSLIIDSQGQQLNKFERIMLDHLSADRHWHDFEDMIRGPVRQWIDIADGAIRALHRITAGNPYYAKLLANELFKILVRRRDCHATIIEAEEAVRSVLSTLGSTSFAHFWDDGIFATGPAEELVTMRRKCLLLTYAQALRELGKVRPDDVAKRASDFGLSDSEASVELRDLVRRQVLLDNDGYLYCKVPLFESWLKDRGPVEMLSSFKDMDAILRHRRDQESQHVTSMEVRDLVSKWSLYKGIRLTEDSVRAWLSQFGDNRKMRLMFTLLQGLKFYSNDVIRQRMRDAHSIVVRGLKHRLVAGQLRRRDMVVSYLDGPGKSGASYARLYVEENRIYHDNVVERSKIGDAIRSGDTQALVFVDDFIGTGESAVQNLQYVSTLVGDSVIPAELKVCFVAITGFVSGRAYIENNLSPLQIPAEVHICEPLDESMRVFGEQSTFWSSKAQLVEAKELAESYGRELDKRHPLGYRNSQAAVVFESSIPNNSLPILWKKSKSWTPLFERY